MSQLVAVLSKKAVVTLLGSQAAGRFQVIGYQLQKKAAGPLKDLVLVQCWIDEADIDWDRSSRNGPKEHEIRLKVQFTAAQTGVLDIATIQDLNSTPADRTAALLALIDPAEEANDAIEEAWSAVFEILDDARNLTLGLPAGSISDKSYSNFKADQTQPRGAIGILTATSFLEFRVKEAQLGDLGNEPAETVYDNTLIGADQDENVDPTSKAGTISKNTFP